MTDQTQWVVIERVFDASCKKVWAMWTNPEAFKSWYGPNSMTIPVAEMDVNTGGARKICMEMAMPDKTMTMWFTGHYIKVSPPTALSYTESMCDADGNIISPQSMGMPPGHPEVTEVQISLNDNGDKTTMTMTHIGVPAGSPGEGGWKQAFDKLAAKLA